MLFWSAKCIFPASEVCWGRVSVSFLKLSFWCQHQLTDCGPFKTPLSSPDKLNITFPDFVQSGDALTPHLPCINVIKLKWEIIWTAGLPHVSELPHPGLSLRFQVAGYLLLVAVEVASSNGAPPLRSIWSATSTVFQKALPPQKSNLHQQYSYH